MLNIYRCKILLSCIRFVQFTCKLFLNKQINKEKSIVNITECLLGARHFVNTYIISVITIILFPSPIEI